MAEMPFEEWASVRGSDLMRMALALCGDRDFANDLVQDTFVKLLARWNRLPEPGPVLDAYARRTMVNLHVSAWRTRRREHAIRHLLARPEAGRDSAAIDDRSLLSDVLAQLGSRQRVALVLRYCDLDDRSIAETLGCGEATVRSQISRALASVRRAQSLTQPTIRRED